MRLCIMVAVWSPSYKTAHHSGILEHIYMTVYHDGNLSPTYKPVHHGGSLDPRL